MTMLSEGESGSGEPARGLDMIYVNLRSHTYLLALRRTGTHTQRRRKLPFVLPHLII